MSSFEITEINVIDYINLLAKIKSCKVKLVDNWENFTFDLKDLELMIDYDIQITEIATSFLRTEGEITILLKFAEVMKKMNHLEEFKFDCDIFEDDTTNGVAECWHVLNVSRHGNTF